MNCYVINLLRASERRQIVSNNFSQQEIEFRFITGFDWRELTDQSIFDNVHPEFLLKIKNYKQPHIHGSLACWLSHRKVWHYALQNNENVVAVFEDDAMPTSETKSALNAIGKVADSKFDIVFLYHGKSDKTLYPVFSINELFTLNLVKYDSIGAVGYVITQRAMQTLLEQYPLMNIPIDMLMHYYWWHGLKTYILTPQVIFHGEANQSHHSFIEEFNEYEEMKRLGLVSNSHALTKKIYWLCDRIGSKYLPRISAFRKRLKTEQCILK